MPKQFLDGDLKGLRADIQHQDREVLEKYLFKLAAAYTISKEASSAFDLEKCLNILVDRVAELLEVEIVSVMLISRNKSELLIKIAKGLERQIIRDVRVKLGEGIAGWVAATGEALLVKDLTKDSRFPRRNGKYHTESLLSVPLKIQNKVIGVINVNNKISKDIFNENDLDILKTTADLAAIAVNDAHFQEEAKALDKLRSEFIANVSHELRTPLATVKEAVALILDRAAGDVTDKQTKILSLARNSIDRLERLIDDLLNLSKTESEIKEMKRKLFNIIDLINNVVTVFNPLAAQRKVKINTNLPEQKIEIWGDEDKLCEVITNLIDNAIKYNKPQGRIEIGFEDMGRFVKIYISDSGIGISEQDLDKVFDRFRRIESHLKGEVKGTGLGLSITKDIVEIHGGEIAVESKIGIGSKFIIILPKNLRLRD
jgi:signal transduction histidine kinase